MRIAVTGATGNIGSTVLRRLSRDDHEVIGLARRVRTQPPAAERGTTTWVSIDLTRVDPARLARVFRGVDVVVHLAWGFQPSHDLGYLEELGVGGTRRVAEAVVAAGVPHLVHMSSVGAYSPRRSDDPVDEGWPTDGVATSRYSRHKAAAERLLDTVEAEHPDLTVSRLRPGIVGQRSAGSALLRYGLPAAVPSRLLVMLPILPLDRGLALPMVHSDDVAEAVAQVIARKAGGAFNLAADPPLRATDIASALGARLIHVPSAALRPLVSVAWHLRLQPVDTGWLDLAFAVPLLDCTRARTELGWTPTRDAVSVFREVVHGMSNGDSGPTAALRPRTVAGAVRDALRDGPIARRRLP